MEQLGVPGEMHVWRTRLGCCERKAGLGDESGSAVELVARGAGRGSLGGKARSPPSAVPHRSFSAHWGQVGRSLGGLC